jgi:pyruvate/2-oxoglutarate dehydrogenase complex dihydrolipoamide acyltransferase (E2) component
VKLREDSGLVFKSRELGRGG